MEQDKLISIKEAAERMGVHENTLRVWDNKGTFKAIRLGVQGHRRYRQSDVERFINGRTNI